jgi:hypothetical protein
MLGLVLGLDMDGDQRVVDLFAQLGLDRVADRVSRIDRHRPGHHQMEVDERPRPCLSRTDIVGFDRAIGIDRDDLADPAQHFGIDRNVHETDDALADQLPS